MIKTLKSKGRSGTNSERNILHKQSIKSNDVYSEYSITRKTFEKDFAKPLRPHEELSSNRFRSLPHIRGQGPSNSIKIFPFPYRNSLQKSDKPKDKGTIRKSSPVLKFLDDKFTMDYNFCLCGSSKPRKTHSNEATFKLKTPNKAKLNLKKTLKFEIKKEVFYSSNLENTKMTPSSLTPKEEIKFKVQIKNRKSNEMRPNESLEGWDTNYEPLLHKIINI